jgi:hypothetical protein
MANKEVKRFILFFLLAFMPTIALNCQDDEYSIQEAAEEIMALGDDYDPSLLLEQLSELKEDPVRINCGDEHEIARLFFLSEFQVRLLADHISRNGSVVSLYELSLLPAFDRSTVKIMAPYITLRSCEKKSGSESSRTTVTLTASTRLGDDENESGGIRSLLRVKHDAGRLNLGMTAENDPGESFSFRKSTGSDFLSGYIMYRGRRMIDRVIIGDYSLRFGEGLVFNSSSWQGSWLTSPSFMTGRSAAVQYTSSEENSFLRGISVCLGSVNAGAMLFASSNMIDARPLVGADSVAVAVSNLVSGGIHVSRSQLEARNSLTEAVAGIHLTAGNDYMRGGVTSAVTWFSLPFRPDTSKAENIHAFTGSQLLNLSADLRAGTGPILFFAEAGMSLPGSWAATAGLRAKPSGRVTFNLLARHFSPDYYAFHSGAVRAGSGSGNETGIAASMHLEAARHFFITAAADHYRIPWPRYRTSSPSYGNTVELKGEYLPRDDISFRLSYTSSSREYDYATAAGTALSVTHTRQQAGFLFICNTSEGLRLTTRASACLISPSGERGYLLCQDFSYSFRDVALRLWFRYAICSTGGWDSRLYAWEDDLLSSFSVPSLYGECTRAFVMASWKPWRSMELRAKYAFTIVKENLSGRMSRELKIQCRILF